MAISMLQDAQQRNLAAALAGIKRDDVECSLAMSPPMSANTSGSSAVAATMYPGLHQAAAASAFSMFSPTQLMAANRQAAAAFMAAQLPMSQLASTLFPHHPATLFGSWAAGAAGVPHLPHLPLSSSPHSPPASPHSPIACAPATATGTAHTVVDLNTPLSGKHSLGTISPTATSQGELPPKKSRKSLAHKKEITSPPTTEFNMSVGDLYHHHHHQQQHHHTPAGPMSPPSSGSSPNSTHESSSSANHVAAKDASRDKSFTCKICSRSFGYKHVLQNHERTHTGEKPFECPECHKRFTRDHHLKTHMRLHTGEKPYHCSHCDRQFVQVANLRRHLRVHTGERPYTCEICDGKFSDSNQLKSHMLVHNGEKPFECERCHVKFRRRHHLINHKCGTQSPPTPALSPAMSGDYGLCDQKSAMGSSYCSEESIDLGGAYPSSVAAAAPNALNVSMENVANASTYEGKTASQSNREGEGEDEINGDDENDHGNDDDGGDVDDGAPLDLSEDGGAGTNGHENGRCRKPHDIRRVFRLPPRIVHVESDLPVQTEPEDLSMHTPRACELNRVSSMSMSMTMRSRSRSETTIIADDRSHEVNEEMMMMVHHDDIDLDELDDAATLYLRQQQYRQKQQQQLATMTRGMRVE